MSNTLNIDLSKPSGLNQLVKAVAAKVGTVPLSFGALGLFSVRSPIAIDRVTPLDSPIVSNIEVLPYSVAHVGAVVALASILRTCRPRPHGLPATGAIDRATTSAIALTRRDDHDLPHHFPAASLAVSLMVAPSQVAGDVRP